jgi:hypothetical protein
VWVDGCVALKRSLKMAAWSAEMYCRQLDARFGSGGGGQQQRHDGSGSTVSIAAAALPETSELTQQCLSIMR